MKRVILLCIIVLMSLSGCKEASSEENTVVTKLTVWHYYGGTAEETFNYLLQSFNQTIGKENNIVVEGYSYDGVSALSEAVQASASGMAGASPMPSIFASYVDDVLPLKEAGLIADLDDYFTDEELSQYYEPFINEGRIGEDGALSVLPIAKSTEVLHINKTIFDEFANETDCSYADLTTWEGLAEVSKTYYEWTDNQTTELNDGKAFFGTDGMANFMIVGTKQLGKDIFVENNGKIIHQFTESIAQKFWEVFYIPYVRGYFTDEASYRSDDVASGKIVAYVGSTASSYYFPSQAITDTEEYQDIECMTLPYPVFEDGEAVAIQQGAGMVVRKSSIEEESAAAIFLKWFTENDNNSGFAVSTGYMPVKEEVLNSEHILDEMGRDGEVDESLPIVQATNSSYQQLDSYELYSSIPFSGSADARWILESSLLTKIRNDKKTCMYALNQGEDLEEVFLDITSEDNFREWYKDICSELEDAIE